MRSFRNKLVNLYRRMYQRETKRYPMHEVWLPSLPTSGLASVYGFPCSIDGSLHSPAWIAPNSLPQVFQRPVKVFLDESQEPPVIRAGQSVGRASPNRTLEQLPCLSESSREATRPRREGGNSESVTRARPHRTLEQLPPCLSQASSRGTV